MLQVHFYEAQARRLFCRRCLRRARRRSRAAMAIAATYTLITPLLMAYAELLFLHTTPCCCLASLFVMPLCCRCFPRRIAAMPAMSLMPIFFIFAAVFHFFLLLFAAMMSFSLCCRHIEAAHAVCCVSFFRRADAAADAAHSVRMPL